MDGPRYRQRHCHWCKAKVLSQERGAVRVPVRGLLAVKSYGDSPTFSSRIRPVTISDGSPCITRLSWGHLEVEGGQTSKDAKLFPGDAREWDWRETGTDHLLGTQPADVNELVEHNVRVVILGREMQRPYQDIARDAPNARRRMDRFLHPSDRGGGWTV